MGRIEDQLKEKVKTCEELQAEYDKAMTKCIKGLDEAIQSLVEMRNEVVSELYAELDLIRKKAQEVKNNGKAGV